MIRQESARNGRNLAKKKSLHRQCEKDIFQGWCEKMKLLVSPDGKREEGVRSVSSAAIARRGLPAKQAREVPSTIVR